MSEKIFIRTKGEDTVFFAKITKMRSIDFTELIAPIPSLPLLPILMTHHVLF